jgi:hypothetical protein
MLDVKGNACAKAAGPVLQPLPRPAAFSLASLPRDPRPAFALGAEPLALAATFEFLAMTVLS